MKKLKEKVNDIREEIQQALKPLEIELERLRKEYQETADER